jgi:hypothetical protein
MDKKKNNVFIKYKIEEAQGVIIRENTSSLPLPPFFLVEYHNFQMTSFVWVNHTRC